MPVDIHVSSSMQRVRRAKIPRAHHAVLGDERAMIIANGLGSPRFWCTAATAACAGFAHAVEALSWDSEAGARMAIDSGYAAAREQVLEVGARSLDKLGLDAALIAMLFSKDSVTVMSVGPMRVYVMQDERPRRLSPKDTGDLGIVRGTPRYAHAKVARGDMLLAGSEEAFSVQSISKVGQVIGENRNTQVTVLASLLTEPAEAAGQAAVGSVVRIR